MRDPRLVALWSLSVGPPQEFIWFFLGLIALLAVFSYFMDLSGSGSHPTPDRCWKGGIFYVNHDDPALFVRKRFRGGYTLNFGNPWSWAVLALLVLLAVAPVMLAALSARTIIHRAPCIEDEVPAAIGAQLSAGRPGPFSLFATCAIVPRQPDTHDGVWKAM